MKKKEHKESTKDINDASDIPPINSPKRFLNPTGWDKTCEKTTPSPNIVGYNMTDENLDN